MNNAIWNLLYKVTNMSYRMAGATKPYWYDITVNKYEIIKETNKFLFLKCTTLNTFNFWENKAREFAYKEHRYKKEDVNIEWVETREVLLERLEKYIWKIHESKDITENQKELYQKSYELIVEYLKNNQTF